MNNLLKTLREHIRNTYKDYLVFWNEFVGLTIIIYKTEDIPEDFLNEIIKLAKAHKLNFKTVSINSTCDDGGRPARAIVFKKWQWYD